MASELRVDTLKSANGSNSVSTETAAKGSAKAWVNLDGSATFDSDDTEIRDSFNIDSTIDNGAGNYDATFTAPMSTDDYSVGGCLAQNAPISSNRIDEYQAVAESASQINLNNFRDGTGQVDAVHMYGQVFGDLA